MTFVKVHLSSVLVQTPPNLHSGQTLSPKTEFDQSLSIGQYKLYTCYMLMALAGALILGFVMLKLCKRQNPPTNNANNLENTTQEESGGGENTIESTHRLMRLLLR